MTAVIALIDQIAIGIYFLILAGILLALRRFLLHGEEYRSSYFELERDLARYRRLNAVTLIVLLLELALIVIGIQLVVVPELLADRRIEALLAETRAEDGVFETPVPAAPAESLGIDPVALPRSIDTGNQLRATPLPTPTPVGTIIPAEPCARLRFAGSATGHPRQRYARIPARARGRHGLHGSILLRFDRDQRPQHQWQLSTD